MEATEFEGMVRGDLELLALVTAIGERAIDSVPIIGDVMPSYRSGVDDTITTLAIYALFGWMSDSGVKNNNPATTFSGRRMRVKSFLVEVGIPPDEAARLSKAVEDEVNARAPDDSLLLRAYEQVHGKAGKQQRIQVLTWGVPALDQKLISSAIPEATFMSLTVLPRTIEPFTPMVIAESHAESFIVWVADHVAAGGVEPEPVLHFRCAISP